MSTSAPGACRWRRSRPPARRTPRRSFRCISTAGPPRWARSAPSPRAAASPWSRTAPRRLAPLCRPAGRPVRRRLLLLVLRQQDRHDRRRRHVPHQLARARHLAARAARPRHGRPSAPTGTTGSGFNYRLTNIQAAIGHAQLARASATLQRNHAIVEAYRTALHGIPGVRFPPDMDEFCKPVVWLASVQVPAERRDALLAAALRANIETASILPFAVDPAALPALCAALSEQPRALRHRREPSDVARR